MPPKPSQFTKETDLCAAFIAALTPDWVAYPETAAWDILLVRVADGCQIGIQAKLRLNADVLTQAAEGNWIRPQGPDYRAVLVPDGGRGGFEKLAAYCAITVVTINAHWSRFRPELPTLRHYHYAVSDWFEMMPMARHPLPDYVPDVAAGAPAPIQLTKWKIGALKLSVLLDRTGYLTRHDFKRFGIDSRRWIAGANWLRPDEKGFVAGPGFPDFKIQHPRVWEEIAAAPEQWQRHA